MGEQISSSRRAFLMPGVLGGLIAVSLVIGTAQAQSIDHYQRYKAKQLKGLCQEDLTAKCKTSADLRCGATGSPLGASSSSKTQSLP